MPAKIAAMVEGSDSLFDLPVCSAATRNGLAEVLDAERARPMTGRDEVDRLVGGMAALLASRRGADGEGELYLAGMAEAFEDVPADLFAEACRRARKTLRFMPAPVELRQLIGKELGRRRYRMGRMKMIIDRHDREGGPAEPVDLVPAAEMTALVESVTDACRSKGERVPAPAPPPPGAREKGPGRMPTASDMAALMGVSVEEAQAAMDRAAQDPATLATDPTLAWAIGRFCDDVEGGKPMTGDQDQAFASANEAAIRAEMERRRAARSIAA